MKVLYKLITVIVGIGTGIVSGIYSRPHNTADILNNIIIALLCIILVDQLFESFAHNRCTQAIGDETERAHMESETSHRRFEVKLQGARHTFEQRLKSMDDLFQHRLRSAEKTFRDLLHAVSDRDLDLHYISALLQNGSMKFSSAQMPKAWLELLWHTKKEFLATSYISPASWDREHPTLGLKIQEAKIAVTGVTIKRVFIIDELSELEQLRRVMDKQHEAGIKVRFILRDDINQIEHLRAGFNNLKTSDFDPTLDFGLCDSQCAFLWELGNRQLHGGHIVFTPDIRRRYEDFFDALFSASVHYAPSFDLASCIADKRQLSTSRGEYIRSMQDHIPSPTSIYETLKRYVPQASDMVDQLVDEFKDICSSKGVDPAWARMVVSWGGGKDSTYALVLAKAVSEVCGCNIRAYTMYHPGLTPGVFANINHIRHDLHIHHEYRLFDRPVTPPFDGLDDEWHSLYRKLWVVLGQHPRFMCVACNFVALSTEYYALSGLGADFHVSGNSRWELDRFDEWVSDLQNELESAIEFPRITGNTTLDYYNVWWAVYNGLLQELHSGEPATVERINSPSDCCYDPYLYPAPQLNTAIAHTTPFCVIPGSVTPTSVDIQEQVLELFGWRLPDDLQGGTESDCAYTALITMLNINNNGLDRHLSDLELVEKSLVPPAEMIARARDWAMNGQSEAKGKEQLHKMGLSVNSGDHPRLQSGVAWALAQKLFRIR